MVPILKISSNLSCHVFQATLADFSSQWSSFPSWKWPTKTSGWRSSRFHNSPPLKKGSRFHSQKEACQDYTFWNRIFEGVGPAFMGSCVKLTSPTTWVGVADTGNHGIFSDHLFLLFRWPRGVGLLLREASQVTPPENLRNKIPPQKLPEKRSGQEILTHPTFKPKA